MSPGNRVHLLSLADREFRQLTEKSTAPIVTTRKFKAIRLNLSKFDHSWDRKRGAAVRLMGVLLREDDSTLERRVRATAAHRLTPRRHRGCSASRPIFGRLRGFSKPPAAGSLLS
jgi:hypothetical protein